MAFLCGKVCSGSFQRTLWDSIVNKGVMSVWVCLHVQWSWGWVRYVCLLEKDVITTRVFNLPKVIIESYSYPTRSFIDSCCTKYFMCLSIIASTFTKGLFLQFSCESCARHSSKCDTMQFSQGWLFLCWLPYLIKSQCRQPISAFIASITLPQLLPPSGCYWAHDMCVPFVASC